MYVCIFVCLCVSACVCVRVCVCIMYVCMYVCLHALCMYSCMYVCNALCIRVCMNLPVYVTMYIRFESEAHRSLAILEQEWMLFSLMSTQNCSLGVKEHGYRMRLVPIVERLGSKAGKIFTRLSKSQRSRKC